MLNFHSIDVNECEEFGVCDQHCINSFGKYECSCDSNYELVDNHKCKIKGIIEIICLLTLLNYI